MAAASRFISIAVAVALLVGTVAATSPAAMGADGSKRSCSRANDKPFKPISLSIPGLGKVRVQALRAQRNGVPRTLPFTHIGKSRFAWDRPGFDRVLRPGHVLMNAHVWPDGSAIGNRVNSTFKQGLVIKVKGADGQVQCYRLTKRVVRQPSRRFAKRYYGTIDSRPRLAILTCTGVRRGPGDWSHRSVWFAKPIS